MLVLLIKFACFFFLSQAFGLGLIPYIRLNFYINVMFSNNTNALNFGVPRLTSMWLNPILFLDLNCLFVLYGDTSLLNYPISAQIFLILSVQHLK